MAELIKVDKNGTRYFWGMVECPRCHGKGIYYIGTHNGKLVTSPLNDGRCFQCGGSGRIEKKWKEYTPEYEAKLIERRKKKAEQRAQELEEMNRAQEEQRAKEEAEQKAQEEAERARKAQSRHIGEIGDKLEMVATVEKQAHFDIPSFRGFGTDTMWVYTFRTDEGDALVWKTTSYIATEDGERVTIKGTVKEHSEYRDEKQTLLTRCRVTK